MPTRARRRLDRPRKRRRTDTQFPTGCLVEMHGLNAVQYNRQVGFVAGEQKGSDGVPRVLIRSCSPDGSTIGAFKPENLRLADGADARADDGSSDAELVFMDASSEHSARDGGGRWGRRGGFVEPDSPAGSRSPSRSESAGGRWGRRRGFSGSPDRAAPARPPARVPVAVKRCRSRTRTPSEGSDGPSLPQRRRRPPTPPQHAGGADGPAPRRKKRRRVVAPRRRPGRSAGAELLDEPDSPPRSPSPAAAADAEPEPAPAADPSPAKQDAEPAGGAAAASGDKAKQTLKMLLQVLGKVLHSNKAEGDAAAQPGKQQEQQPPQQQKPPPAAPPTPALPLLPMQHCPQPDIPVLPVVPFPGLVVPTVPVPPVVSPAAPLGPVPFAAQVWADHSGPNPLTVREAPARAPAPAARGEPSSARSRRSFRLLRVDATFETGPPRAVTVDDFYWLFGQIGVVSKVKSLAKSDDDHSARVLVLMADADRAARACSYFNQKSPRLVGDAHAVLSIVPRYEEMGTEGRIKDYSKTNSVLRRLMDTTAREELERGLLSLTDKNGWCRRDFLWGRHVAGEGWLDPRQPVRGMLPAMVEDPTAAAGAAQHAKAVALAASRGPSLKLVGVPSPADIHDSAGRHCRRFGAVDLWGVLAVYGPLVSISRRPGGSYVVTYRDAVSAVQAEKCLNSSLILGGCWRLCSRQAAPPPAPDCTEADRPQVGIVRRHPPSARLRLEALPPGVSPVQLKAALCAAVEDEYGLVARVTVVVPGVGGAAVVSLVSSDDAVLCLAAANGRNLRCGGVEFVLRAYFDPTGAPAAKGSADPPEDSDDDSRVLDGGDGDL